MAVSSDQHVTQVICAMCNAVVLSWFLSHHDLLVEVYWLLLSSYLHYRCYLQLRLRDTLSTALLGSLFANAQHDPTDVLMVY